MPSISVSIAPPPTTSCVIAQWSFASAITWASRLSSSSHHGSLAARNRDLIQPLNRSLSTCTQSPSRLVTLKRVPLGAVARTRPLVEGADLMWTPGRCRKTMSSFCMDEAGSVNAAFRLAPVDPTAGVSFVMEAGRSGHATATDGSAEDTDIAGALRGEPSGADCADCTAPPDCCDCAATFSPADDHIHAREAMPNAARITVAAMSI